MPALRRRSYEILRLALGRANQQGLPVEEAAGVDFDKVNLPGQATGMTHPGPAADTPSGLVPNLALLLGECSPACEAAPQALSQESCLAVRGSLGRT
jgi:hypothetical protein